MPKKERKLKSAAPGRARVKDQSPARTRNHLLWDLDQKHQILIENSPDGICIIDRDCTILFFNRVLPQYPVKDILGTNALEFISIEQREEYKALVNDLFETGKPHSIELLMVGPTRWLCRLIPLKQNGKTVSALVISTDITELRKMEEEVLRIEKLEAVGLLAGGIAHDFNNILTAILGNIFLAKTKISADPRDPVRKILGEAENATHRAKELANQLLTFSKGGTPNKQMKNIVDVLKETAQFVLRGTNARAKLIIPDDLWAVEIDEGQIIQVIQNMVINAQQAMPEGGVVKIVAENVDYRNGEESALPLKAGSYVKISIKDSGTGIPEAFLQKIFDPYFTTKKNGSGLGLATSYSIIKKHGGYIKVASVPRAGTTFSIFLPAYPDASGSALVLKKPLVRGKGKVLFMDDEESVLEVGGQILQHLGYEVKYAREGAAAVEIYRKSKDQGRPFDLVILDLTVPGGMSGKEAIQKLIEIDPGVKAMVTSGYSDSHVMSEYKKYGFVGRVSKPYKMEEFSEAVASAMKIKMT